jgi:hypothetical protein
MSNSMRPCAWVGRSRLAFPNWTFLVSLLASCAPSTESQAPALERPASSASVASFGDLRPEPDDDESRPAATTQSVSAVLASAIDSDLASVFRGGGCYPPGIKTAGLEQLILVDPEWAPVENGQVVQSTPVLAHGTVVDSHGDRGGDFPATHVKNDQNTFVRLDEADSGRLATGNKDGLLDLEWEVGAFPDWAWASPGDRVVALGRWIFECGHPDPVLGSCSGSGQPCILSTDCDAGATCNGTHFNYRTEMHPPQAVAVLRPPHGAVIASGSSGDENEREDRDDGEPQLATRADVFVSAFGGAVGDHCILTHRDSILELIGANCFPLSEPVAPINDADFSFDLPLPPPPRHASAPIWAITPYLTPGVPGRATVGAEVAITPVVNVAEPHLAVTVRMSHATALGLPTGFAASIAAGWQRPREVELKHVRVFIDGILVRNPLKPAGPVAGRDAPGWRAQVAVNGSWRQLSGLQSVEAAGFFAQNPPLVTDLFLERQGTLRIRADGASSACVDTMFAQSIGTNLYLFGSDPIAATICLNTVARDPGTVDASFSGPGFGARHAPHQTMSLGGQGQLCSGQKAVACMTNADCPAGETCAGAFALQYRIVEADSD